jgi:uncharacterized membrane protein YdfJ with MMPL/SSD domain
MKTDLLLKDIIVIVSILVFIFTCYLTIIAGWFQLILGVVILIILGIVYSILIIKGIKLLIKRYT